MSSDDRRNQFKILLTSEPCCLWLTYIFDLMCHDYNLRVVDLTLLVQVIYNNMYAVAVVKKRGKL